MTEFEKLIKMYTVTFVLLILACIVVGGVVIVKERGDANLVYTAILLSGILL
ncbi:MAG: hypothetical protein ACI4IF_07185 [Acutalibacteraceae bacterium]